MGTGEAEMRRDKRGPAAFSVTYRVLDPIQARLAFGEEERDGIAENLSEGGLSLSTNQLIPPGSVVSIRFRAIHKGTSTLESGSRKFELRGEARHSHHTKDNNTYSTGIRFFELKQEERDFIKGCF